MNTMISQEGAQSSSSDSQSIGRKAEEFSSLGGSYIKLGGHKNNAASTEMRRYNESFLGHFTAPGVTYDSYALKNSSSITNLGQPVFGTTASDTALPKQRSDDGSYQTNGGLKDTKFGTGFTRKNIIENPAADFIAMNQHQALARKESLNFSRADSLRRYDEKSGYNLISHAPKGAGPKANATGKRRIEVHVSDEIAANSRIELREGSGRFHCPQASGIKHEYRQYVLCRDGLHKEKFSAVLQPGKADLPSYGVEDNFGKSQYPGGMRLPPSSRIGLWEMREPGKFTPRKQPGHPSGNALLVKNWGSGMDIANNTLRGRLR